LRDLLSDPPDAPLDGGHDRLLQPGDFQRRPAAVETVIDGAVIGLRLAVATRGERGQDVIIHHAASIHQLVDFAIHRLDEDLLAGVDDAAADAFQVGDALSGRAVQRIRAAACSGRCFWMAATTASASSQAMPPLPFW
jgi:hypothetical protein